MKFCASTKILGLFMVAGFVLFPAVTHASHTTDIPTDPTTTSVTPGRSMPWYDRDETLGSFIYHYPIALPPGRNGMQPQLALTYNSASIQSTSILGAGWSFSIPSIERMNKTGIEDLYDSTYFTSSLSGELLPVLLTDDTHGAYGAKVETGPFLSYSYDSTETWIVTNTKGTTYTFGSSSSSRVDDPDDTTRIFTWYVSEIRDTNNNFISFTYTKDDNQLYPATITYTGSGSTNGAFVITFTLEARGDAMASYASGFEITTDQRVSAMTVTVNGATRRTASLTYTAGDNSTRSLLSSIVETGYDEAGVVTSLPETAFDYSSSTVSWTADSAYSTPQSFVENYGYDRGVRFSDVNGDGLQDLLFADSGGTDTAVYLNDADGTGWSQDTSYTIPVRFLDATVVGDQGVRFFDVNGDGLDDLVYGESDDPYDSDSADTREVYINDGGAGWTQDSTYSLPANFATNSAPYYIYDAYTRLGDVNGDGLADILFADPYGSDAVYLHNGDGTGWTEDTSYTYIPVDFGATFGGDVRDSGVRVVDVNHDGLADLVYGLINGGSRYSGYGVYINNGDSSWTFDTNYSLPVDFSLGGFDLGARLSDVNADGWVDIVVGDDIYDDNAVYLNTGDGTGWTLGSGTIPVFFTGYDSGTGHANDKGVRLVDVDGDGLEDFVYADATRGSGGSGVYVHDGVIPDLLTGITSSQGGETSVVYAPSVQGGVQEDLPFIVQVVASITTDDGLGNTSTESFQYEEGDYYYEDEQDRQFTGFGQVTKTDGAGNTIVMFVHQGDDTNSTQGEATDTIAKLGRAYREERYDSAGSLYRVELFDWQSADLGNNRTFVYLEDDLELLYDGDADHVDHATSYTYDVSTGVTLTKTEYGEVNGSDDGSYTDTGDDDRTTTFVYATDATDVITVLPSTITLTDTDAVSVSQTRYTYDDMTFGSVATGNVTQEEIWISGTDYASTSFTYDTYGNVLTQTDPLGNTRTNVYDSYNLYPSTITNAYSQTQTFEYDPAIGKPTQVVDVNSAVTQTDYDGLGRPTQERRSSDTDAATLEATKTWTYDDTNYDFAYPRAAKLREYLSSTQYKETIQYLDGFDRVVETKILDDEGTGYNETETTYDVLGRVSATTLVEVSADYGYDLSTVSSDLSEMYTYDALGRVTEVTNVLGTTSTTYDGFTKTVTDAVGNQKAYETDGLGRLIEVVENLDGTAYRTTYAWSATDKLLSLVDALGNVRAFTYDGRGLRLSAEDIHEPSDTTYGTWVYTYDDAGNLETSYSPNAITTTYVYDVLNRVSSENADSTTATDVTYTYDSCTNGTGQVCEVTTDDDVTTSSTYTASGRLSSETKTFSSTDYTTSYTYDTLGNVLTTTHPDGTLVINTYNTIGKIETIDGVVTDTDYGAHGEVTSQTNTNGTITTYTYDATQRYRLSSKITTGYESGGTTTTTTSFYPTTGDGWISKSNASWDSAHDATSGSSQNSTATYALTGTAKSTTSYFLYRAFLPFDTSSIPDDATVTSAVLNVYVYSKKNHDNDGDDYITLVQTSQTGTTSLTTTDFDQAGSIDNPTEGIDTSERKDLSSVTTNAYLTFTLNSTGLGWISNTGITKLGLREGHDVIDSAFTSSSTTSSQYNILYFRSGEYSGTSQDPYLSVTYTQTRTSSSTTPVAATLQDLSYTYDAVGNITQIVDASDTDTAKTTDYVYDDLYRLTSVTVSGSADGNDGTITYDYDAIGNITSRSDVGTYSYDGTDYANPHAVTSILTTDGATATYSYDNNGNLTSDGITTYTWDEKNRLVSSGDLTSTTSTTTTTATASFYPTAGDGQISKSNASWDSAHDATAGSSASATSSTYLITGTAKSTTNYFIYRSFLPFDTSSLPDDATVTSASLNVYPYQKINHDNDGDDFVTVVQTSQASTSTLSTADFDQAGTINNPTEGVDTAQRKDITSITTGAYLTFNLNSTGLGWISNIGVTKLGLREGHDVIDSVFTSSSATYSRYNYLYIRPGEYAGTTYDPYLSVTYTYPTTTTTTATTNEVTYTYDHAGHRVSKTSDSGTTYYPTSDYSVLDGTSTVYVSGSAGLTASISSNLQPQTSTLHFFHTDHLGSTSVVTDEDGIMIELLDYNPYGTERISWSSSSSDGESESHKTYIGEYSDDESGLSYLNARYYDPERGQFLSQDPVYLLLGSGTDKREQLALLDPQSQNGYLYGRGNPIGLKDESGEFIPLVIGIAWLAFEAGSTAYDVYTTADAWMDPNGSAWDRWSTIGGLAIGAVLPGGGYGTLAGKADDAARGINGLVHTMKPFTKGNFRDNLLINSGKTASEMVDFQAHHILPQAQEFAGKFENVGINIHDPKYGAWWGKTSHQQNAFNYNQSWTDFFRNNQNATRDQIENFGREIAKQNNIEVNF